MLGEMLRQAEHVTVTLDCMGLSDHSPETLAVATTAARLFAMGNELAGGCETELLKGNHRTQSEELHLIGKHLFDMGLRRENLPLPAEDKRAQLNCTPLRDLTRRRNLPRSVSLHFTRRGCTSARSQ